MAPLSVADFVVIGYNNLSVLTFTVIIVTSGPYLERFGLPAEVAGAVVGAFPIASALVHPLIRLLLRRVSIKRLGVVFSSINALGILIYALAGPADQEALIFVGRVLSGLVTAPLLSAEYIGRRFAGGANKIAQTWFAALATAAYVIAALIAAINQAAWSGTTFEPLDVFTVLTTPGWIVSAISVLVAVSFCFLVEPRGAPVEEPLRSRVGIVCGWICTLLLSTTFASWNVYAVLEMTRLGLSSTNVCLYVAAIIVPSLPLFFVLPSLPASLSIVLYASTTLVGAILTVDFRVSRGARVALFTIGSLLLTSSTVLRRAHTFYLANDGGACRDTVVAINSFFYMIGLGLGATITPFLEGTFGPLVIGLSAAEVVCGVAAMAASTKSLRLRGSTVVWTHCG